LLDRKPKTQTTNHLYDLFGKPPLIKGEDEAHYLSLRDAFEEDIKPKTFSERMKVNDLTNKYWERLRLQRFSAALIEGACIEALASLLRPFVSEAPDMKDAPNDIARFYYVGQAGAKKRAILYVEECGITNDQIFALAMQMRGAGLLLIDRMDNNRENACRILRKEIERRAAVNDNSPNRRSHDND
jgi:hypothetical protein